MRAKFILSIIGALFTFCGKSQSENSLLWKIESADYKQVSYVFGTYHLVGSDYLDSNLKVKNAFEKAEHIVVEMVMDSTKLMEMSMMSMMPEKSLKGMVDSVDYLLLKEELEPAVGMSLMLMDKMKPMVLSAVYAIHLAEGNTPEGLKFEGQPIDFFFAANGKKSGKEVTGLETMMEQAEILYNGETPERQAEILVEMVKEKEASIKMTAEIIKAYQEENLEKMQEISDDSGDSFGDMEELVDARNQNWIPKLKPILEKGNAFIAVGALHLPGENGVIQLLRNEGFILTPVLNP